MPLNIVMNKTGTSSSDGIFAVIIVLLIIIFNVVYCIKMFVATFCYKQCSHELRLGVRRNLFESSQPLDLLDQILDLLFRPEICDLQKNIFVKFE